MWFSHWVWGKPYSRPFRCAIKCFSLSEDFLSPVAFSINSSQTDKSLSIGPDARYRSSYSLQVRCYLPTDKIESLSLLQMKAIWILTTLYTPCCETVELVGQLNTKLPLCGGDMKAACGHIPKDPYVTPPHAPSSSADYLFPPAVVTC